MIRTIRFICVIGFILSAFLTGPASGVEQLPDVSPLSPAGQPGSAPPPTAEIAPTAPESSQVEQAAPTVSLVTLNPDSKPAELVIRNRKILTLHADVGGLPPQMRVSRMQQQFPQAVSGAELTEPTAKDFPPYGVVILINNIPVASIAHLDLDPLDNKPHDQVVAETLEIFSQILAEIREERSTGYMLKAVAFSLLATLALAMAIWLLVFLRKLLLRFLVSKVETTSGTLTRVTRLDFHKVAIMLRRVITFAVVVFIIFLIFTWLAYVLKQFPYTRPWGEGVWTYVLDTCRSMGLVIVDALPNLFKIALILLFARLVAKLTGLLFEAAQSGRITLPGVFPETARPTRRIIVAINYVFALVACYPYLPGSDSDAFKGMTVLIGLMISLGGSGVINQAMSGLVLMFTRAHQVGDYVRIGETEGVVTALDMLATKIRTSKREEVTIPNSVVLGTATKNFTRLAGKDGVILHTTVTIGYSAPWRKIHEILIEAANRTAELKRQPPAFVMQTALSDFYVEYQLNAYLEKPEMRMAVLDKLHTHIQDTFNEAGIAIVSPHYVADPPEPMPTA
ncbi:MAG: mechanosensitive ion channel family protein [Desulfobulbaceae bacterium]|nr:mechanosensitive ion channel family protein [Desulfobulbaceae bacterium]